jgi:cytochrome b561
MQLRNSETDYGALSQFFHWLTVLLVVGAWLLGEFDDVFPRGPARASALFTHITFGLLIILMVAARLSWRLTDRQPTEIPGARLVTLSARLAHYGLYILLIAVPVAGIVVQFARGNPLPVFGLGEIASVIAADRPLARSAKGVHELLANALMLLALLHAGAALAHHYIFKDRTLLRMLPFGRERAG